MFSKSYQRESARHPIISSNLLNLIAERGGGMAERCWIPRKCGRKDDGPRHLLSCFDPPPTGLPLKMALWSEKRSRQESRLQNMSLPRNCKEPNISVASSGHVVNSTHPLANLTDAHFDMKLNFSPLDATLKFTQTCWYTQRQNSSWLHFEMKLISWSCRRTCGIRGSSLTLCWLQSCSYKSNEWWKSQI